MDENSILSSLGDNGTLMAIGGFLLGFWVLRKVIKLFIFLSLMAAVIYFIQGYGG